MNAERRFSLQEFLKLGGFSHEERTMFYDSLQMRCYLLSGRVYIRTSGPNAKLLEASCTGSERVQQKEASLLLQHQSSSYREGESAHFQRTARRSDFVLDNESANRKPEPTVIMEAKQQLWELPDYPGMIRDILARLAVEQTATACVMQQCCAVGGVPCSIQLRYSCGVDRIAFLELGLATPYRELASQRVFLCAPADMVLSSLSVIIERDSSGCWRFARNRGARSRRISWQM